MTWEIFLLLTVALLVLIGGIGLILWVDQVEK